MPSDFLKKIIGAEKKGKLSPFIFCPFIVAKQTNKPTQKAEQRKQLKDLHVEINGIISVNICNTFEKSYMAQITPCLDLNLLPIINHNINMNNHQFKNIFPSAADELMRRKNLYICDRVLPVYDDVLYFVSWN